MTQFLEDPTHPLWQGATHTRVSLNSDRPSIRAFTMHLTIIFRYKITDNTNIPGTTSKMFLPHVKTKNELTIFLAEKAITNFENVNGGYAVSYTTILFQIWWILHKKWWHITMEKQTSSYYYTQLSWCWCISCYYSQESNTLRKYSIQDW